MIKKLLVAGAGGCGVAITPTEGGLGVGHAVFGQEPPAALGAVGRGRLGEPAPGKGAAVVGIDGGFSRKIRATRGITAGSGFATSELRVLSKRNIDKTRLVSWGL